jgi:hypothetical protein
VKNGIVTYRIGAAALALVAVLAATVQLNRASSSVDPAQASNARPVAATGEQQHVIQGGGSRHDKAKWILKVDAMRTRWVLRDSRVPLSSDDIYSSNDRIGAGTASSIPSTGDAAQTGQIKSDGEPNIEASPDLVAPNEAQAKALDPADAIEMGKTFAKEVERRLNVPAAAQLFYGAKLQQALQQNSVGSIANEYVVLVDRSKNVQALFIYFRAKPDGIWQMLGATPVSTGLPGSYDHFVTPLGVFQHTPSNMDFRSEGTLNEFRIRGYGARDMRIYDFGWAQGERGWGKGGMSQMRFQMHATDPDKLEPVLGVRHSKGCVRIPAALNVFFDNHGILDADYEARVAGGQSLWILKPRRAPTPWDGRYLVIIDSAQSVRPSWSPLPDGKARSQFPAHGNTAD